MSKQKVAVDEANMAGNLKQIASMFRLKEEQA